MHSVCWDCLLYVELVVSLYFEMQNVINSFKGTALGVAEYLTPVLKVSFLAMDTARIITYVMIFIYSADCY